MLTFAYTYADIRLREYKRYDSNITKSTINIYSSEWAVHLEHGNYSNTLEGMGFEIIGKVGNLPNMYRVRHAETHARHLRARTAYPGVHARELTQPSRHVTTSLLSSTGVKWAEQQVLVQRYKREVTFTDPLYPSQWNLRNIGQFQGRPGEDINIMGAWDDGYTGSGVQIAVIDDGYQHTHPDLSKNYAAADSVNFNGAPGDASDPSPDTNPPAGKEQDRHGTAVAGVAMGASNGVCGVGAAFEARGAGIRMISSPVTDATEADGITYHNQNNHIYSNSWGPPDDGIVVDGPKELFRRAVEHASTTARGGKGSIYVWAAGNGGEFNDNCNYDGYANQRFVIAVGAVGIDGKKAFYSEPCAALVVAAPSSSYNLAAGIRTIDLVGPAGYVDGNCLSEFGGTSSACPLVAGVIALMLQANAALSWRDVTVLLASTARKNDPTDADWTTNDRKYNVNHKYGFGVVDASAAVKASKTHVLLNAEQSNTMRYTSETYIQPNSGVGFTANFEMDPDFVVERVVVTVVIDHPNSGDLLITLTSPHGTESVLAEPHSNIPVIQFPGSNSAHQIGVSQFGPPMPFATVLGRVVPVQPYDACGQALANCDGLRGAIAYVAVDGYCDFTSRARLAQECGAIAMLVYNTNPADGDVLKILPGISDAIQIPVGFVDYTYAYRQNLAGKDILLGQARIPNNAYRNGWSFSTVRSLGEKSRGTWKVNVADPRPQARGVVGTISQIDVSIYGSDSPASFTSESTHSVPWCLYTLVTFLIVMRFL